MPVLSGSFPKSAIDVKLDQSTLRTHPKLEDCSFLLRSYHSGSQLADTGSPSRAPRERSQYQILKHGEPRPGKFTSVIALYSMFIRFIVIRTWTNRCQFC